MFFWQGLAIVCFTTGFGECRFCGDRSRKNAADTRHSRPDSGRGFHVKVQVQVPELSKWFPLRSDAARRHSNLGFRAHGVRPHYAPLGSIVTSRSHRAEPHILGVETRIRNSCARLCFDSYTGSLRRSSARWRSQTTQMRDFCISQK